MMIENHFIYIEIKKVGDYSSTKLYLIQSIFSFQEYNLTPTEFLLKPFFYQLNSIILFKRIELLHINLLIY